MGREAEKQRPSLASRQTLGLTVPRYPWRTQYVDSYSCVGVCELIQLSLDLPSDGTVELWEPCAERWLSLCLLRRGYGHLSVIAEIAQL